ncbi:MAG TPA: peptidoglycan DD-metalloendopeptidase family protein [Acidimicrobiia bacterium]|nr:peptidoglycan DD-metalloendopeptidase family protein [Acidimicrobiia bacterium]
MRRLLTFGAAVLSLVLFAGAASGASQAELEELNRQISRLSEQIEAARSARTQAAEEVLATKARLDSVTAELRQAEGVLASINAEIAAGEEELASVTRMLEHFESMLATTRLKAEDTRSALSRQVIEMYMSASTAPAKVLSFASAEEAWVGLAYVDGARGDSSQLLRQLDVLEAEEERQQGILDEQRRAQERLLAELAEQREAQEAEVARVDSLRAQYAAEAQAAEALVASLNAEIAKFEEHKEGLEADAAALEKELAARGSTGAGPGGPLARPVPGGVSSGFGYRIHPIFGTRRMHTGWDMSASSGSPIHAAGDGVVVSAGTRGGYGNAVVIDHGGGLATLYAHQSSMAVSAGQQVSQGQVIGYVGCTGYCTGPHLHFEVRVNGTPVDPGGYVGG